MALRRVWIPSPNYSARANYADSVPRILVLHTAEGSRSFESLGSFFANPNAEASSQVGIDDERGVIGEYVDQHAASWTQAAYNGCAISAELCGFAEWDRATWLTHHSAMLANAREWLAEESAAYGIPLVLLSDTEAQGGGRGVCGHVALGAAGGGHWDPGPGFPWDVVLGPAPVPADEEVGSMVLHDLESGGLWVADKTGAIFAYDGAPYLGGLNSPDHTPGGEPCVGIADDGAGGYVLVADFGDNPGDRFRRYHYPRR